MIPAAILIDTSDGLNGAVAAFLLWLAASATWILAVIAYYLVNLSFLWDERGRGWHDRVAGTIVVRSEFLSDQARLNG